MIHLLNLGINHLILNQNALVILKKLKWINFMINCFKKLNQGIILAKLFRTLMKTKEKMKKGYYLKIQDK